VTPDGDDVEITAAGEEAEDTQSDENSSAGLSCHFHAGVEYVLCSATSCTMLITGLGTALVVGPNPGHGAAPASKETTTSSSASACSLPC
jgi:hypothetical protein